jgi:signal transduction histidine kinase
VQITGQLDGENRQATISVSDTGTGIAPEVLPISLIASTNPAIPMGPAWDCCQNLIVAHGGEISAQSDGLPGHGTTIRFTLPLDS